jgi:trehalose 6-phosphate synthase/phosphatase
MFIDYDGTLTPIVKMPHLATPSSETLNLLAALASDPKNKIYVISGRDRKFLEEHLGKLPIGLSGEHGSFLRPCPQTQSDAPAEWQFAFKDLDLGWKDAIFALFEDFTDRTPGSFIEAKEVNVNSFY